MSHFVYIIYSRFRDKFYVGQTQHLDIRVQQQRIRKNLGVSDWELVYNEEFLDKNGISIVVFNSRDFF